MRRITLGFTLIVLLVSSINASAGSFVVEATPRQLITPSNAGFGTPYFTEATGTIQITLDLNTGTATGTGFFTGHDFVTPSGSASYDLYNSQSTGTISLNLNGATISHFLSCMN